ncbi:MAG: arylsulfatase [Bryobacterales bacterium]|nr:arylsulfatase [Bryobacterales bacterium]
MTRRDFVRMGAAGGACAGPMIAGAAAAQRPNIIVMLADDIGYGDLGCYGATRAKTPNLDRLAARGVRFTDAHSSSATCTPTRYSLMTGEYAFRKKGTGVLPGDAALIVDPARPTVASILQQAGYATGCVGKWHLGLGSGNVDWNGEIAPGPREVGFDYSFIVPATGDRVPCVYVENRRVAGLDPKDPIQVSYKEKIGNEPTGRERPDLLKMKLSQGHDGTIVNGISRIGFMSGGKSARWVDEDMAQTLTGKAASFIEKNRAKPFFLYFATHDIHVPRVPNDKFRGTSQCGLRCDAIRQLDWCAGQLLATLERLKLTGNTLVIFTSDNGPVVDDGYNDGSVEALGSHKPAGPLRGGKYSIYEGGTRMPFLASWPARIKPGVSDALISQVDLAASFASLTGGKLADDASPDSLNMLPALLGESRQGRDHLVEHAQGIALRKGPWKLIPAREAQGKKAASSLELFNLAGDIGETKNVAAANPEVVREMSALLENIRKSGRSRPLV